MSNKNKKNKTNTKTLVRIATLVMVLGFAGSTLAIALSSVFSNPNHTASESQQYSAEGPSLEEQIQMRVDGYEKVLAREPKNITALEGLAQIHLQTQNPDKAISILEKMVEYYPERQEFASILQVIKQQQTSPETEPAEPKKATE